MAEKEETRKIGFKVRYQTAHGGGIVVILPFNPRKGVCDACGKSKEQGEIKITALHHWYYQYATKTVRENPVLALDNTNELCFPCHELGDAIRALLYAHPKRVAQVAMLLKGEPRERFIRVLRELIVALTNAEDTEIAKKILEVAGNGKSNS